MVAALNDKTLPIAVRAIAAALPIAMVAPTSQRICFDPCLEKHDINNTK